MTALLSRMDWIFLGTTVGKAVFAWSLTLGFILVNIFLERKVCALIQDRVGPNRANILGIRLFGFVLNFADAVKLLFKEDITPDFVNKFYYVVAPLIIMTVALMGMSVVPFADDLVIGTVVIPMRVLDLNVGFLFILAITSLSVYSLVLGGFGSNSKYPLFAAMRSSAQMISYEIVMGLSLVGLVMVYGTVHLQEMALAQGSLLFGLIPRWGVVVQPLGCVLFCIAALAELNRTPFDLPEGESEIIGFHVEYSSMKFALFFMAEYANIFVAAAVITTLFFGGWQIPWLPTEVIKAKAGRCCSGNSRHRLRRCDCYRLAAAPFLFQTQVYVERLARKRGIGFLHGAGGNRSSRSRRNRFRPCGSVQSDHVLRARVRSSNRHVHF